MRNVVQLNGNKLAEVLRNSLKIAIFFIAAKIAL
jgi:hypothetical protein